MGSITENNTEEEWIRLENSKKNFEDDFEYEELKREVRRKHRAIKKQAMRRYLKEENPDFVTIINNKIYGNPGDNLDNKIRKRRRRNSGSSDSGADVIRIKPNPPPLYSASNKQEERTFVNTLNNYWDAG